MLALCIPQRLVENVGACSLFRRRFTNVGAQGLFVRVCAGIAYLDPGNLESQLQAGAQAGYDLMWVLLWVIIMVSAPIAQYTLL